MTDTNSGAHTNEDMLQILTNNIVNAGSQKKAAKKLGITPQYLCDIMKGKRLVSEDIAKQLGFERRIIFMLRGAK